MSGKNKTVRENTIQRRSVRRALAAITPADCHPQRQSLLFSILPSEVRFDIFKLVLSQHKSYCTIQSIAKSPVEFRPGHTYTTKYSTSLLETCRLIYYEGRHIPARSATYHVLEQRVWNFPIGNYPLLQRITKERGEQLYHLHTSMYTWCKKSNLSEFFLPHLNWRRVTWTMLAQDRCSLAKLGILENLLNQVILPESCQEATLEFEVGVDPKDQGRFQPEDARQYASNFRKLTLARREGSPLIFDDNMAIEYIWVSDPFDSGFEDSEDVSGPTHLTVRLVWRAKGVARRTYTSYDHLECMKLEGIRQVKEIRPFPNTED